MSKNEKILRSIGWASAIIPVAAFAVGTAIGGLSDNGSQTPATQSTVSPTTKVETSITPASTIPAQTSDYSSQPSSLQSSNETTYEEDCDSNYEGGCVPVVDYDLNCADIDFSVEVVGSDVHGFDGNDDDGYGCESN